jgi:uncharacterized membrane protein
VEDLLPGLTHAPNLHPFFVHFPLVLWPAALVFWVVGAKRGGAGAWRTGSLLLMAAVFLATAPIATGLAAEEQFHDHAQPWMEKIHVHRNFMIGTTVAAALVLSLAFTRWARTSKGRWVLVILLALVNVAGVLGGDRGAELVLRHGVGTEPVTPKAAPPHPH